MLHFSVQKAKQRRLVNEVYVPNELMEQFWRLAAKITEANLPQLLKIKALMNEG
jgi:enoyl-CoA hydratase/carnithine racemase